MKWVLSGAHGSNDAAPLVSEYFEKKVLAKLGYSFDSKDLSCTDVEIFTVVESEINEYNNSKLKKSRGRR